jgi:hypothetical protein
MLLLFCIWHSLEQQMNDDMIRMMEGDGEGVDLFAQLLAQAKDDGLQDRLDDLRDKGKV